MAIERRDMGAGIYERRARHEASGVVVSYLVKQLWGVEYYCGDDGVSWTRDKGTALAMALYKARQGVA